MTLRLLILLLTVAAAKGASWTLSSPPYTVTDLGSPIQGNTEESEYGWLDGSGHTHLTVAYSLPQDYNGHVQLADVDMVTGTAHLVTASKWRPGPNGQSTVGGKLYIGTQDPGYFGEYNPATGAWREIGAFAQKGAQLMEVGDDGSVYIGMCCAGGVQKYVPGTDTLSDLGRPDPSGGAYQYTYTIGSTGRYIFAGLGQSPWYLAIIDTVGGATNLYWKADSDTEGGVYKGTVAGKWFYSRGSPGWYELTSGTPVLLGAAPSVIPYYEQHGGVVNGASLFPSYLSYDIGLTNAYPDNLDNSATYGYKPTAGSWSTATVSSFTLLPVAVSRMLAWTNKVLCTASYYGSVFTINSSGAVVDNFGRPQISVYDLLSGTTSNYISGYPANTLTFNPGQSWTLNGSTDINSPSINPHSLGTGWGKYHYYSAFGSDGNLYVAAHHERDSTGGELGWYPVASGTRGSDRADFSSDDPADLIAIQSGAKMAYSATTDNLFIFDVAGKSIDHTWQPMGAASPGKLIETASGSLLGASGTTLYLINPTTGSVTATAAAGGTCFGTVAAYNRRFVKGPDGYGWLYIGDVLNRVNPTTLALTHIVTNTAQNVIFNGGDLYFYGLTNLSKISGLLTSSGSGATPITITNLRIGHP
jgi:hypothetical protein